MTSGPNLHAARLLVEGLRTSPPFVAASAVVEILPPTQSRREIGRVEETQTSEPLTSGQMLNDLARTLTTAVSGADDVSLEIDADREGGIHIKMRAHRRGG